MRPLLAVMDAQTAREFTSERWPQFYQPSCDFRYRYRFIRSLFSFNCINNKVSIAFRGNYQIAGSRTVCALNKQLSPWVTGSCGFGEPLRRVDLNISSTLQLLPDHRMVTNTQLDKLSPLEKCQVTVLQTDLTQQIMDSIRSSVNSYCKAFDGFVQDLNNSAILLSWRKGGSRVMSVSKYGFMNLNPSAIEVGPFNYLRDSLFFTVGFRGYPKFSSDSLSLVTGAALPQAKIQESPSGISTYLEAAYTYESFNRLLNDSLRNKPFTVEGRTFVIKNVKIGGSDDGKLNIEVAFTGNRTGVLRLSGTPVLDAEKQVISMPDINFALDTRDMFVNMAKGLFRKRILKKLKDQSVLDIAALIERNMALIQTRMNQPVTDWMSLTGTCRQLKLLGLLPQKDRIQLQIYLHADLALVGSPPTSAFLLKK